MPTSRGVKAEINVTPLVDVVFVLLIVFMVVTPLISSGMRVQLPAAQASRNDSPGVRDPLVISVTADRGLFIGTDRVAAGELAKRTRVRLASEPSLEILVKADRKLAVADIRPVLRELRDAGARQVRLGVAHTHGVSPRGGTR